MRGLFFGFFTLVFYIIGVYFSAERPRVLILQSYGPDYSWTRDVDMGIRRALGDESFFSVRWHYMDTKNHPEKAYLERAGLMARRVIDLMDPQVIVAIDDDAQKYAATHYVNRPGMSIVYSGVNGTPEMYGYDKANNVTGILERIPIDGIRDTITLLNPAPKKPIPVVHLSDKSLIVHLDDAYMKNYDWGKFIDLKASKLVETFDDWKESVNACNKEVDYIIISNYRKIYVDAEKTKLVPPKEVMAWTMKNARVPIIGVNSFVAEDGANLAVSTSPYEQGIVAAQMVLMILRDGKSPKEISVAQTQQFIVSLRKGAKEFQGLPVSYKNFALYADKYYEK